MRNLYEKTIRWPWIWFGCITLSVIVYFVLDRFSPDLRWIAVTVIFAVSFIMVLTWHLITRNRLMESVVNVGLSVDEGLQDRLDQMSFPYAILSRQGKILWKNEAFTDILDRYGTTTQSRADQIQDVFPGAVFWEQGLTAQEKDRNYVKLGGRIYETHIKHTVGRSPVASFLLTDETEHLAVRTELENERNAVGLIYVDNYEELLKNTPTEQHSLLGAMIEQQIQKYFQAFGGIVCKTERDRFFISINHQGLERCCEDRFSILEEIKKIRMSNTMLVTLSVAFGHLAPSYSDNLEQAQAAIDLALGRGGDQAIIKTPSEVRYFGGKALGQTTQTRVKARVKAQALREIMAQHEQIFIMGHANGDNDSFGATVAMYRAAVSMQKEAHIVLNTVSFSVRPLWERFMTSADYPRDMFVTSEEALALVKDDFLMVVVDTNVAARTECPELIGKTTQVVLFDHHRQMSDAISAVLSYVEPYASSACEMIVEILQYFSEDLTPLPLEADAIYSGILVDTNNFSDRTSARTFEAAAYLKRCGADLIEVKKLLREDYAEFKAKASGLQSAEVEEGGFAFADCQAEGLDSPTVIGSIIANELLNIAGIRASFVFTQIDNVVFISARSIDEVNVQLVMERLGGGGHLGAAGAQLKDCSAAEAREKVKEILHSMQEEGLIA